MSGQTTIDDRTADVIRSAIAAAEAGRLADACEIGERGLAKGGDPVALNALIGAFHCSAADYASAIPYLAAAHEARPADPLIARNFATALTGDERYEDVVSVLSDELVAADRSGALRRLRGFAAQMSGDLALAIMDFEKVLSQAPGDWETWNNLGNSRASADDLVGAIAALRKAAEINPEAAPARLNLARALRDSGDFDGAEAVLRSMAADFPSDAKPLVDLYHVLRSLGRDDRETEEVLDQAAQREPDNIDVLLELGGQQIRIFEFAKAEHTYRSVIDLQPSSGKAFFGLALVLEHLRPDDLPGVAAQAEGAADDEDRLNFIRAFAARRAKKYDEGLKALSKIPQDLESATRWHLVGQMYDGLGEYDAAFDAFTRMNEANSRDESEPVRRASELRDLIRRETAAMTAEWKGGWAAPLRPAERPAPVFLAGFPRSGTTLLDTMLMGHPDVEVMEEQPILRKLELEFGGFEALAGFDENTVRQAQRRYFELAAEYVPLREGSVLVDKSPLYLQRVAQIYRLFPDARFILALRHPADVVLSCFMSNFRLNSSMTNFLRLDTTAEFYDLTFKMWERALGLFPVEVQTVGYERMIEDPESVLKPLIEGLDLDWNPQITDHEQTAKERGVITTASYAQVTQPLYRGAVGRWQRYRKHLEPVLPTLEPWIEKFGYEL